MFKEDYKKAYDRIKPDEKNMEKIWMKIKRYGKKRYGMQKWTVAAAFVAVALCVSGVLPAFASRVPDFYKALERVSPEVADLFVPIQKSCSNQGIIMQVEAVDFTESHIRAIISFQDEEGTDKIHGPVDLYDAYGIKSYSAETTIAGCSFRTYDSEEDKAYFLLELQTEECYTKEKLTFYARGLRGNMTSEEREIDLSLLDYGGKTKSMIISGYSGGTPVAPIPESFLDTSKADDPRTACWVLDTGEGAACKADDFTITGIAYVDEVLRVQICMGENTYADRHVQPFLVDAMGNERHEDYSVSWSEDEDGMCYDYYEYWFLGPIEDLESCRMYGIFHNSAEIISGEWSVTFRLE